MPDAVRTCKICGKVYPYCRSLKVADGVFKWQDVACCVEHGSEYLAAVLAARGEADKVSAVPVEAEPVRTRRRKKSEPTDSDESADGKPTQV